MQRANIFLIGAILLAGCSNRSDNKSKSGNTELPSLSYTVYSEKVELFAEFRTPVIGDTMKLAGHFTETGELFTAITGGTITLTLRVGDNSVSQTSGVSTSPGIFRYAIVPEKSGVGKLIFDIKNKDFSDQIVIDSVMVYADAKTAQDYKAEEGKGNEITYLKEQAWKVEFANMEVRRRPFSAIIKTTGEILPAQGDEMVVTANANGIVMFAGNKAVVGTSVNKGEMLFAISGGNLTDGNTETLFIQAKAAYDKARADYDRALDLSKDNIISQKDFLETKARYETEQANYNNLARNYQSGGQKVVSPISGL